MNTVQVASVKTIAKKMSTPKGPKEEDHLGQLLKKEHPPLNILASQTF